MSALKEKEPQISKPDSTKGVDRKKNDVDQAANSKTDPPKPMTSVLKTVQDDISDTRSKSALDSALNSSQFLSIHLFGSLESGEFSSANDVYIKYSIVTGPDWILSCGSDVGITQISRFKGVRTHQHAGREFIWNQPISVSYRSYNYYGWPQIVLSAYYFDIFGKNQILGYGSTHLPVSSQPGANIRQRVDIYAPESSSISNRILSWLTGRRPELVDSNLFARPDCRKLLQVILVGHVNLVFNLTTKDVFRNGYRS